MKDCHSIVILLKFLLLLDLLVLAACVALAVCYGSLPPQKITINRLTLLYIILMLGAYGVFSLLCNCLATYGVKNRIKAFLVPYLIFYPLVVAITTIFLTNTVLSSNISVVTLLLPLFINVVLTLLWLRFVRLWYVLSTVEPDKPLRAWRQGRQCGARSTWTWTPPVGTNLQPMTVHRVMRRQ